MKKTERLSFDYLIKKNVMWILVLLFAFMLPWKVCGEVITDQSQESTDIIEKTEQIKENIVYVESICWNGDNIIYSRKGYTGTVISEDSNTTYILTLQSNLTYSDEEKQEIRKTYQLEENERIQEKIEVVFQGDLRIQASLVGESEQRNLSLLKLNQSVQFENIPVFSDKDMSDGSSVYLFGYTKQAAKEDNYNSENVERIEGSLTENYSLDGIKFHYHDIQENSMAAGGTLYNKKGYLVGMLQKFREGENGTAISGSEMKNFLKTFKVPYSEYEKIEVKKKRPILNYILGVVIGILLLILLVDLVRETRETKVSKKTEEKKQSQKRKKESKRQNASIEYPAEKRMAVIAKTPFVIGRSERADFVLEGSKGISREHASISFVDGEYYIVDLHSMNHTYLNGAEVSASNKHLLRDGDEIMVGKEQFIFKCRS